MSNTSLFNQFRNNQGGIISSLQNSLKMISRDTKELVYNYKEIVNSIEQAISECEKSKNNYIAESAKYIEKIASTLSGKTESEIKTSLLALVESVKISQRKRFFYIFSEKQDKYITTVINKLQSLKNPSNTKLINAFKDNLTDLMDSKYRITWIMKEYNNTELLEENVSLSRAIEQTIEIYDYIDADNFISLIWNTTWGTMQTIINNAGRIFLFENNVGATINIDNKLCINIIEKVLKMTMRNIGAYPYINIELKEEWNNIVIEINKSGWLDSKTVEKRNNPRLSLDETYEIKALCKEVWRNINYSTERIQSLTKIIIPK